MFDRPSSNPLKEHRLALRVLTTTLLKRFGTWRRKVRIIAVLGGALIAGLSGALVNILDPDFKPYLWSAQAFGTLLIFVGVIVLEFLDESAPEAIRRAHETIDKAEEANNTIGGLHSDFTWFTRLYSISRVLMDLVEGAIAEGLGTSSNQIKRYEAMLDVVVADSGILCGINGDRWNFALYLFDDEAKHLSCVVCRRPIRAEEEAAHRSWLPGEGHVGIAFQTQREIVASDTSDPESSALFDAPPGKGREDDRSRYRSIASVPIKSISGGVFGVIVGTSDVPGRFYFRLPNAERALDPVEPLRVLGDHLAMLLDVTYILNRPKEDSE